MAKQQTADWPSELLPGSGSAVNIPRYLPQPILFSTTAKMVLLLDVLLLYHSLGRFRLENG